MKQLLILLLVFAPVLGFSQTTSQAGDKPLVFKDATVPQIMEVLSKKYKVNIKYLGKIPPQTYWGIFNPEDELPNILKEFQRHVRTPLLCKLVGNTIYVSPEAPPQIVKVEN